MESQSRSEPDIGKKSLDICGMLDTELAVAVKRAEVRGAGVKAAAKYSFKVFFIIYLCIH